MRCYCYILIRGGTCYYHFFFFNDTATTEIYTLSLHDALPISAEEERRGEDHEVALHQAEERQRQQHQDRKSTRLNSSHSQISYAVFCLKKKITIKSQHKKPHYR